MFHTPLETTRQGQETGSAHFAETVNICSLWILEYIFYCISDTIHDYRCVAGVFGESIAVQHGTIRQMWWKTLLIQKLLSIWLQQIIFKDFSVFFSEIYPPFPPILFKPIPLALHSFLEVYAISRSQPCPPTRPDQPVGVASTTTRTWFLGFYCGGWMFIPLRHLVAISTYF